MRVFFESQGTGFLKPRDFFGSLPKDSNALIFRWQIQKTTVGYHKYLIIIVHE
jgi:hypothetical protein